MYTHYLRNLQNTKFSHCSVDNGKKLIEKGVHYYLCCFHEKSPINALKLQICEVQYIKA